MDATSRLMARACSIFDPLRKSARRAFIGWRQHTAALAMLRSSFAALRHRGLKRAWVCWVDAAASTSHAVHLVLRGLTAGHQARVRHLLGGWMAWGAYTVLMSTLAAAVAAMRHRELKLGLLTWGAFIEQHDGALWALERALHRLAHARLGHALNTWVSFLDARVGLLTVPRRALLHWRNMAVAAALNRWDAHLHSLGVLGKAAAAFRHTRERAALTTWAAHATAEEASEAAHLLRAASMAFANASVLRGLNKWCEWTDEPYFLLPTSYLLPPTSYLLLPTS